MDDYDGGDDDDGDDHDVDDDGATSCKETNFNQLCFDNYPRQEKAK